MLNPPLPASTPFHRPHTRPSSAAPTTLQQSFRTSCAGRLRRVLHHPAAKSPLLRLSAAPTFVPNAFERASEAPRASVVQPHLVPINVINASLSRRTYHTLP
ncbi:hypothetical protein AOQ84DRAFT_169809 [Glonium stellatum]|uniref:Uncharacterized protein n=1 Tax=Glonium stellatum TaxID=574774 RepID=A0A8E2EQI5_9PEZI|nr:hypothetical protein AOQ84DRAFT_169809 [Glonium stellatum]